MATQFASQSKTVAVIKPGKEESERGEEYKILCLLIAKTFLLSFHLLIIIKLVILNIITMMMISKTHTNL